MTLRKSPGLGAMMRSATRYGRRRRSGDPGLPAWPATLLLVMLALVGARIALPYAVKRAVNRQLNSLPEYSGSVERVGLGLWQGAYHVEELRLYKKETGLDVPYFFAERIDVSVDWSALLKRSFVAEIVLTKPALNFVKGPTPQRSQLDVDARWQDRVRDLAPIRVDRFEVRDGRLTYRDDGAPVPVDAALTDVDAVALNLTNAEGSGERLPASLSASAATTGGGRLDLKLELDPLADAPTFELDAALRGGDVRALNDFLKAYGGFDAEAGRFSLYIEASAANGGIDGYAKPLFEGLKLLGWRERKDGALKKFWEAVVAGVAGVLKNQPTDRLGARIPFQGRVEKPEAGVFPAVVSVLRNAFVRALLPGFDRRR